MNIKKLLIVLVISYIGILLINNLTGQYALAHNPQQLATSQNAIAHNPQQHPLVRKHVPQIRRIRKVKRGLPLVMPTYIPHRFRLTDFSVNVKSMDSSYTAIYKGPNACEVVVTGGVAGWGASPSDRRKIVNTDLFGKVVLEASLSIENFQPIGLIAGVIPNSEKRYSPIKSFPNAGYIFYFECENKLFSIKEASKILESMQMFNP